MKISFGTLGCKVNQYESEAMAEAMEKAGWEVVPFGAFADATVINTCGVTLEAERKGRQMIRRAAGVNPRLFLVVTGCSAQLHPGELASLPPVSAVVGNRRKMAAVEAVLAHFAEKPVAPIAVPSLEQVPFEPMTIRRSERTRAYIKIEDGCESRCAYCAIRFARGPIRSKPLAEAVEEAQALTRAGYREIVLTGIEISAYGRDIGCTLGELLEALDRVPGLERLRLGSLDPALLKPAFVEKIAALRHLAHHFHLSLQAGCDKTLAAMRRTTNTAQIAAAVKKIRETMPDATFTADVIVGFPGETEEDFQKSRDFIASLSLLDFHIFAFSPRPGTEAATMEGQIDKATKAARERAMREVRRISTAAVLAPMVGQTVWVLPESREGNALVGHTANFMEVVMPDGAEKQPLTHEICRVLVESVKDGRLIGSIAGLTRSPD